MALCAGLCWLMSGTTLLATPVVPLPNKVVIVIEENKSFSSIIGNPDAAYINSLAAAGANMIDSYQVASPSQPNYIALFSGSVNGTAGSDATFPHSKFTGPNLGRNLINAGYSFGGFSETLPSIGYDGDSFTGPDGSYKRKHNPWVNWQDATVPLPANKLP